MATAKTTIELNGRLYDASSGRMIDSLTDSLQTVGAYKITAHQKTPKTNQGTVVDGFVRRHSVVANNIQSDSETKKTFKSSTVTRKAPAHAKTKLQRSKTLMRPAVKKPSPIVKNDIAAVKPAALKKVDPARHLRASKVPKSHLVKRFNLQAASSIVRREASLPVASPGATAANQIAERVAHLTTSTETSVKHSVDLIEESLRHATSHLETFEDKVLRKTFWHRVGFRNKALNLASLSVAGLLLGGFFAYQNLPNIEMRLAAARSGVSAQIPDYRPAGFSAQRGIDVQAGKVAVTFRSNTSDKNFTVTQQASNWTSDSLLTNHVTANNKPYQTYQDAGKTVYIYDNSNATWVNGGIWYKVEGNASLTSDQLLRIANSL